MHPRLVLAAALAACASQLSACDASARPTAPVAVSQALAGEGQRPVVMTDGCDPESFEAAGVTCVRPGGVTFQRFVDLLGKHGTVGAWRFSPGVLDTGVGQGLLIVNQGGEVHTFTRVDRFGGGVVEILNQLSGNPVPAPECGNLTASDFIAPGASATRDVEAPGTERYQCCIHPWMRLDLHTAP